jgi:hypothetical protein
VLRYRSGGVREFHFPFVKWGGVDVSGVSPCINMGDMKSTYLHRVPYLCAHWLGKQKPIDLVQPVTGGYIPCTRVLAGSEILIFQYAAGIPGFNVLVSHLRSQYHYPSSGYWLNLVHDMQRTWNCLLLKSDSILLCGSSLVCIRQKHKIADKILASVAGSFISRACPKALVKLIPPT